MNDGETEALRNQIKTDPDLQKKIKRMNDHETGFERPDSERPSYTVLSYAWASLYNWGPTWCEGKKGEIREPIPQVPQHLIRVDEQDFLVRDNLYQALCSIRDEVNHAAEDKAHSDPHSHELRIAGRYFWIDVICADQDRPSARNERCRLMKNIYSEAYNVVAWLGQEGDLSDLAMSWVTSRNSLAGLDDETTEKTCTALMHLCQRSYWSRVWVIPEFILAKSVTLMCGSMHCPWDKFESNFRLTVTKMTPAFRASEFIRALNIENPYLDTLLCMANARGFWEPNKGHKFDCLNELDCIYAWLPLVPGRQGGSFEAILGVNTPDYSKSLDELYNTIDKYIFSSDHSCRTHTCSLW